MESSLPKLQARRETDIDSALHFFPHQTTEPSTRMPQAHDVAGAASTLTVLQDLTTLTPLGQSHPLQPKLAEHNPVSLGTPPNLVSQNEKNTATGIGSPLPSADRPSPFASRLPLPSSSQSNPSALFNHGMNFGEEISHSETSSPKFIPKLSNGNPSHPSNQWSTIADLLQRTPSSPSAPSSPSPSSISAPATPSPPPSAPSFPPLSPFSAPQANIQRKPLSDATTTRSSNGMIQAAPDSASPTSEPPPANADPPDIAEPEAADGESTESPEQVEQLARVIYHRLRQRLLIERERSGGSSSGRLPW